MLGVGDSGVAVASSLASRSIMPDAVAEPLAPQIPIALWEI